MLFTIKGLPIGAYLGICGPVECTSDDYNTLRGYIADRANDILEYLDMDQASFQLELTEENFEFYDSEVENKEMRDWSASRISSFIFFSFLIICVTVATIIEIIEMKRQASGRILQNEDQVRSPSDESRKS